MIFVLLGVALAGATVRLVNPVPTEQNIYMPNEATVANVSITLPKLVSFTRPSYTDEARRREIEGVVNRPSRI